MFPLSFATPLSVLLAFSWMTCAYPASAATTAFMNSFSETTTGTSLPPVLVQTPNGHPQPLSALLRPDPMHPDQLVFLHLWDPECPPCRAEMQALDKAAATMDEKDIKVIALAEDPDGTVLVPAFARRYGLNKIKLYIDTQRTIMMALQPEGLPTTYQIGPDGKIIRQHLGPIAWPSIMPDK